MPRKHPGTTPIHRSSHAPRPLGGLLDALLSDLGIRRKIAQYRALTLWSEAVGPRVAEVTTPEDIDQGRLLVRVATSAWRSELTFLKPAILRKLNELVGEDVVKDIVLK